MMPRSTASRAGAKTRKAKDLREKHDPYTRIYELVPCNWEIRYNPYTQRYEFGPEE